MIIVDSVKKLLSKVESLEKKVEKLESRQKDLTEGIGFNVYAKNFLNYQVISNKSFRIRTINNDNKNSMFFQLKIRFYNFSEQNIQFTLFADKIQIGSEIQSYKSGYFESIVFGTYQNITNDKIVLDLSVSPKGSKQVTVTNTTLTVWGDSDGHQDEYSALETNSKYLLSYISNGRLYYKIFNKTQNVEDCEFEFYNESISHSVCSNNEDVFLFRVDPDGNLFFSEFLDSSEVFISDNVSKVTCCFFNNYIIFCYISNGDCFYGEIQNSIVISNKNITSPIGKFKECYLYSNNINNHCYLIITKTDNSNYLLENINNSFSSSENICAEISLNISLQEES